MSGVSQKNITGNVQHLIKRDTQAQWYLKPTFLSSHGYLETIFEQF